MLETVTNVASGPFIPCFIGRQPKDIYDDVAGLLTAQVLSQHKEVNASCINDQIYLWKDINIGVATARFLSDLAKIILNPTPLI
jgi:hypothetical protein